MDSQKFSITSNAEGKIILTVEGEGKTLEFDDPVEAVTAARKLSKNGKAALVIYGSMGVVAFKTEV